MIHCKNLKKVFKNGNDYFYALNNVNMDIKEKEICVIVGPSGSGKTTLLNVLGGVDTVDSGEIIVGGEVISKNDLNSLTEYRRQNIGFVFQFYNLVQGLVVLDSKAGK